MLDLLGLSPTELVRKNKAIWKENCKGKTLSNDEIIHGMLENPKLIEQPIIMDKNQALIR
tara:strand:- start:155 stop:334 length:180 start_codon:yes stop_codon:yes gene_type:complete